MKILKYMLCLGLISLIFTASTVIAQAIDPPVDESGGEGAASVDLTDLSDWMIDVKFEQGDHPFTWQPPSPDLIDVKDLSENRLVYEEPQEPLGGRREIIDYPEGDPSQPAFNSLPDLHVQKDKEALMEVPNDRVVYPEEDLIIIANDPGLDEHFPAIAHGDGYYMVTYIIDGDLYAWVLNQDGDHYEGGLIYNAEYHPCSNPAIAYESHTGLFIVVFECQFNEDDYDIRAIAVSPHSGARGSVGYVAQSNENESNPDIACNARTGSCLLAYQLGAENENSMQGRFLYLDSNGLVSWSGSAYQLSHYTGRIPHLAWGRTTGNYFLTYSWFHNSISKWFPAFTHVYDVPVSEEQYSYKEYLIGNDNPPNYDKEPLGVTYDPCTNTYVMLWYKGDNTNKDIWVAWMDDAQPDFNGDGCVACSYDNEYAGDISFVSDDHVTPICHTAADRVVITYKNESKGIYVTDLRGNNSKTNPEYTWDGIGSHALIKENDDQIDFFDPVIASGDHGKMFVAWNWYYRNFDDDDILGMLIDVYTGVYWTDFLPLFTR